MTLNQTRFSGFAAVSFNVPLPIIETALRRIEDSFVAAGNNLATSVDLLYNLSPMFDRLERALGETTATELEDMVRLIYRHIDDIRATFEDFIADNSRLRLCVRGIRLEVAELDRVVRTIANVSINARIQGNALMPPRPQVSAFIDRLASMSSEAEGILAEVKDAMAAISAEIVQMDSQIEELRAEMEQRILPTLTRYAAVAGQLRQGRDEWRKSGADISAMVKDVNKTIGDLIVRLQAGDATRQRLDRVRDFAQLSQGQTQPEFESVILDLASQLMDSASAEARSVVLASQTSLDSLRISTDFAIQAARRTYLGRDNSPHDSQLSGGTRWLIETLKRGREHLRALRRSSAIVRDRLDLITTHETRLRQIAHQVRLSGLNAVLICAKLGREGRSLRELAQWLRTLTDESDDIVLRLQSSLEATHAATANAGEAGVKRIEKLLLAFAKDIRRLSSVFLRIITARDETAKGFDFVSARLPSLIRNASSHLDNFIAALEEVEGVMPTMRLRRLCLPAASLPFATGSAGDDMQKMLRGRYTMQSERVVHDALFFPATVGGNAPVAAGPAPSSGGDDLDDILF